MYRVYLSLRQTANQSLPTIKIHFSSDHRFTSRFYSFIYEAFSIVEAAPFIDDGYDDEAFDVYLYPRDMNFYALLSLLSLLEHCSHIFYKQNFNKSAIFQFETDIEKILKDLPF